MASASVPNPQLNALLPKIYEELHRLAAGYMRNERQNHTLQPTALVSEAYLRLQSQHSVNFANRAQVVGVAAQMMRRILLNHEEKRQAEKRGSQYALVCTTGALQIDGRPTPLQFLEVDEVLRKLEALDQRQATIAELRIFGEMSAEDIAEFLEVSVATVRRDWVSAKLWLANELRPAN